MIFVCCTKRLAIPVGAGPYLFLLVWYASMFYIIIISKFVFSFFRQDTNFILQVLLRYGTKEQQEEWLVPLLRGKIRSGFAMTEPQVASSDATNIECSISRYYANRNPP